MKKIIALIISVLILVSCNSGQQKPDKPIDEETMANIIYDLSVLDALKSRQPQLNTNSTSEYVYKKYNIDSTQFAQNNRFYSSQIKVYQKIYDKVNQRMEREKKAADSLAILNKEKATAPIPPNNDRPQIK